MSVSFLTFSDEIRGKEEVELSQRDGIYGPKFSYGPDEICGQTYSIVCKARIVLCDATMHHESLATYPKPSRIFF